MKATNSLEPKYYSIEPLIAHHTVEAPLDRQSLFGNDHPLEVEIGCGLGEFLVRTAQEFPQWNFIGIEKEWKRVLKTLRKIKLANIKNIRILKMDAALAFEWLFSEQMVQKIYCLFPCPWPRKKHTKHRLFSQDFLQLLNSRLIHRGDLQIVTDHEPYSSWIIDHAENTGFDFSIKKIQPQFDTKFERKWKEEGQSEFFSMSFKKKKHISMPLREGIPLKKFYVKDFCADTFSLEDINEAVTVIFKDFIFDALRQKAMVCVLVCEEKLNQYIWVNIEKAKDRWSISLAPGLNIFPTMGVNKALGYIAEAAERHKV